jgi:CoA:oxalate CoA-transferase
MSEADTSTLDGLLVLDFSQFLSGPSAALRLADLGATVIKIERPLTGELGRQLYISDLETEGDSSLFHTINRNKRSYAADLKDPQDLAKVKRLIARADVMIENFRPGVMARIGLDFETVRKLNPRIVYGSVTGYGPRGPWADLPGQDLLAQSRSGLVWLNGDGSQGPVPVGLALADILTGAHLVQGILACLLRRSLRGVGGQVEVSLLESTLDFQFEVLTTHLNDGGKVPQRSFVNNAHAYLGAPYGLYATRDGHIALAMGSLEKLAQAIACSSLEPYFDRSRWFSERDAIKEIIAGHLSGESTQHWIDRLVPVDYWCAPVMTWPELLAHEGFRVLDFLQDVVLDSGATVHTTRCPIRIDGVRPASAMAAPKVGEHNEWVEAHYLRGPKENSHG